MKSAAMSSDELKRVSDMTRGNVLEMIHSSGDAVLDIQLYETTLKKISKGFIEGPVDPRGSGQVHSSFDFLCLLTMPASTQKLRCSMNSNRYLACICTGTSSRARLIQPIARTDVPKVPPKPCRRPVGQSRSSQQLVF